MAAYIWFSAMLADEYILIVPFAYHLQFGLDEKSRATEYNINYITLLSFGSGLTNHGISAQQKALPVAQQFASAGNRIHPVQLA